MRVNLFDIGVGNALRADFALATELSAVFGVPNLTGATVGVATVSPVTATVPESADFALGLLGLAAQECDHLRSEEHGDAWTLILIGRNASRPQAVTDPIHSMPADIRRFPFSIAAHQKCYMLSAAAGESYCTRNIRW